MKIGGDALPIVITLLLTSSLLIPMTLSFGSDQDVADDVVELRLDWLRSTLRPQNVSPEKTQEFITRLEEIGLEDLGRFSPALRAALQNLPYAMEARSRTADVPEMDQTTLIWTRVVDQLLEVVYREAVQIDLQKRSAYRSLLSFSVIVTIGFAILWIYQTRRVRTLVAENITNRRISSLERRVREHERRRLARELHDGLAQELAAAKMMIDRLEVNDTTQRLGKIILSAADQIRLLHRAMDPRFTEASELVSMLHELTAVIRERSGQHFDLKIEVPSSVSWSPETKFHLFRVAQEGLNNVVRHAGATWARLSLTIDEAGDIVLQVEDNGVGIEGSDESYGRQGMRERMELIGGRIEWRSRTEGGTCVEARVPVEHDQ